MRLMRQMGSKTKQRANKKYALLPLVTLSVGLVLTEASDRQFTHITLETG
jgi:hypothetical protein